MNTSAAREQEDEEGAQKICWCVKAALRESKTRFASTKKNFPLSRTFLPVSLSFSFDRAAQAVAFVREWNFDWNPVFKFHWTCDETMLTVLGEDHVLLHAFRSTSTCCVRFLISLAPFRDFWRGNVSRVSTVNLLRMSCGLIASYVTAWNTILSSFMAFWSADWGNLKKLIRLGGYQSMKVMSWDAETGLLSTMTSL